MTERKPLGKRILKWTGIAFLILFVLLIIAAISIDFIIESRVKGTILSKINQDPNRDFDYSFEDLDVKFWRGSLSIKGVKITPTQNSRDSLYMDFYPSLIDLKVEKLRISGIGISELLFGKDLLVNSVEIIKPEIDYYFNSKAVIEKKEDDQDPVMLKKLWSNSMGRAVMGSLDISDTRIAIYDIQKDTAAAFTLNGIHLSIHDILVDTNTLGDGLPFDFTTMEISTESFQANELEYYTIESRKIVFLEDEQKFQIHDLKLIPKFDKKTHSGMLTYADDWFDFNFGLIEVRGLDLRNFSPKDPLEIQAIEIADAELTVYRDKTNPLPPYKYKMLPVSTIQKIPVPFSVDSLLFNNLNVTYMELDINTDKPGVVHIDKVNGIGLNVTNIQEKIEANPVFSVRASAVFMNTGAVNTQMSFYLNSNNDLMHVKGTVGKMPFTALSPVLENLLLVKISEGTIHRMDYDFMATDELAEGNMRFSYEKLKVAFLKAKNIEKENKILNLLGNTAVVSNNMESKKKFYVGQIFFYRFQNKAIFNYLWNSMKSGVMTTMIPETRKGDKAKEKQLLNRENEANPGKFEEEKKKKKKGGLFKKKEKEG